MTVKPAQASVWDWIKAQFQSKEASENMQTSITQEGVSGEKHVTETTSNLMNVINLHVLGTSGSEATESAMLHQSVGSGLIGTVNSGIVAMYDPPVSSQIYLADLLQNAKIIPEAQAQGLGFASLDPILETWKHFRNVAYLFFVVIFLVIGFMIMFRAKIGQAAITVQQAIPNIIVALLAVTFSYAIAGFLIDLMYLLLYLLSTLFYGQEDLIAGNIFTLVGAMFKGFGQNVNDAVAGLMKGLLGEGFVSAALGWLSSLSAFMIVGLAILFSVFKIFLELLKSYIAIILQVVLAPVILMVGAIPGQNAFASWLKNLTGNLLMWPIILICLLVNRMLTGSTYSEGGGFMPPYLLGSGQGAAFPALVGIGILLVIPEIMKEAKKMLGVSEGIMGNLAGAAMKKIVSMEGTIPVAGAALGSVGGGLNSLSHLAFSEQSPIKQAGGLSGLLNQDPDARRDSLGQIRNIMGGGYKNQEGKMVGGFANAGKKGFKWGQNFRVQVDRLREGRFLDVENVETQLSKLLEAQENAGKGKDEKGNTKDTGADSQPEREQIDEGVGDV